jgi:GTP-binding protein
MVHHKTSRQGTRASLGQEEELSAAEIEAGRLLFARPCAFVAGAANAEAVPPARLVEIAFAGRSNVGKSSLLNALVGQRALARASSTPGRTQQINFFDLGGRLMLVDLPGYGHAAAAKHRIAEWSQVVRLYLKGRAALRRVLVLVDARHGLKPPDTALMDALDKAAVSYQAVLTKCDAIPAEAVARARAALADALRRRPAAHPRIAATSADAGLGVAELRAELARLAGPADLG